MQVKITGSTSPMSIAQMWYADRVGELFEVSEDQKHDDMYLTTEPIYKEICGHIYKSDCEVIQ